MATAGIAALWIAFAATHLGLSSRGVRPRLVAALGARGFQGVYSLVALACFVPLCWMYFANQHAGPALWYLGHAAPVRWLGYAGMALALGLIVGGLRTPSPAGIAPAGYEARGALAVTRHPVFMAAGLFGAVHLLVANVGAAELAFFGGFPLFALAGCAHQDGRKRAESAEYAAFCDRTPFVPFASAASWRGLAGMGGPLLVGAVLAALLRVYHARWFGGADWWGLAG